MRVTIFSAWSLLSRENGTNIVLELERKAGMKFKDVISPLSVEEFKDLIEKRPPYKIWRSTSNLENLFGWKELNSVLRQQRTNDVDVSILSNNRRVSVQDTTEKTDRKFRTINQLNAEKVVRVLRDGGTIRISRIDEKSDLLDSIASDGEDVLDCQMSISLYAGFGSTHQALAAHYDRHDVLVIQLEGRKVWEVFGFGTNSHPIRPSEEARDECPAKPVWCGELGKGQMLFLPRGSWHQATVMSDTPTLQVSVAFHHAMLHEIPAWLRDKLVRYPVNYQHLLGWNTMDDLAVENDIRKAFEEILKPGFLSEYRRDKKSASLRRFRLGLPDLHT